MSSSVLNEACEYAHSRLLRARVAALWLLVAGALVIAAPGLSPDRVAGAAGFLLLAVAVLRLWDDLADREHDRVLHPERVLTRTTHVGVFAVGVVLGLAVLAATVFPHPSRVMGLIVLVLVLGFLYHGPAKRVMPRAARAFLVIAKYPILVFVAGAPPSQRAWAVTLVLYVVLGVFEWLDDRELKTGSLAPVVWGATSGLLALSALFYLMARAQ